MRVSVTQWNIARRRWHCFPGPTQGAYPQGMRLNLHGTNCVLQRMIYIHLLSRSTEDIGSSRGCPILIWENLYRKQHSRHNGIHEKELLILQACKSGTNRGHINILQSICNKILLPCVSSVYLPHQLCKLCKMLKRITSPGLRLNV